MTGSLQIRNGKYYVVSRIPDSTGKIKQKWIQTGLPETAGKRKAQQSLRRILEELETKKIVYSEDTLFLDWIWKWLDQKKNEVRLNSYEAYELYVTLHIEPYFKPLGLTLNSLTPQHLQDYYNLKLKGIGGNKKLSPNSIAKHHVVIHGALQEAMKKNLIPYNQADRVTLPPKQEFTGKAYTVEQANKLMALLDTEPLKSTVVLGLFYGLRRSEVCGLRWQDIDFGSGTLIIRNTVVRTKTLIEHEKTKNRKSKRTMILIPETIQYLKRLRAQQAENKLLLGREYQSNDHVCVWPDGKPVSPDYVSHAFRDFLLKNDLPLIRFHELRHTAGSLLLDKGLSIKQIQEYLGHTKAATTLDIYGHLSIEGKKEAAQTLDGLLDIKSI